MSIAIGNKQEGEIFLKGKLNIMIIVVSEPKKEQVGMLLDTQKSLQRKEVLKVAVVLSLPSVSG